MIAIRIEDVSSFQEFALRDGDPAVWIKFHYDKFKYRYEILHVDLAHVFAFICRGSVVYVNNE